MKLYLVIACAVLATIAPAPAPAQQQSYETRLYTPPSVPALDQDFGMQSATTLTQQTMAPSGVAGTATGTTPTSTASDFFDGATSHSADFPDVALPSDRRRTLEQASSSTLGSAASSSAYGTSSLTTDDTPLYTTSEGMTTGDMGASSTTK